MPATLVIPTGEIMQRPPAFSAVKVGGERLYERARRGDPVEGEARPVTVLRAELLSHDDERACFEIECSSGTYVRQLVADLGDAYCEELERTAIGEFRLEDADPERVVPLEEALGFLPACSVSDSDAEAIAHGRAIPGEHQPADAIRLVHDGRLVAIARAEPDSLLKPYLVFSS